MYKIIGADQKEYGPVTAEQLRQWIVEGRIDAHSQVQAEGGSDWTPLSALPEFADALRPATAQLPPLSPGEVSGSREAALGAIKGPAIALVVTAILNMLLALWTLLKLTVMGSGLEALPSTPPFNDPQVQKLLHLAYGPLGIANDLFGLAVSALVLIGALKMQGLRNYTFAYVAAILALLPCVTPCCVLGLPFGIWALMIMHRPEVKSQFS